MASRFAAFALDLIVLTGIFLLVLAAINFTASVLWAFIYFAHFWGLNGKIPGGALFGVQVMTNNGDDMSRLTRGVGGSLCSSLSGRVAVL